MILKDIVKNITNIFSKSNPFDNSKESIVFFDSTGRIIGTGEEGFRRLSSEEIKPTFFELEENAFGRSPWVYIVVQRIATLAASVRLELLNADDEEISNRMRQSNKIVELQNLIEDPQTEFSNITFQELVYTVVANFLLSGNGYIMGLPESGTGLRYTDLISPRASNVSVNDNGKAGIDSYTINYFNLSFTPRPIDVLHMSLPNLTRDLYEGHSAMQSLVNIWKANNALNSNEQFTHERKGANGIVHAKSNQAQTPTSRQRNQDQLDEVVSSRGRVGRMTYLDREVGYIDLAKSFKDLESSKSKNAHRETIAAAYNYPSVLLNDATSSVYNNVTQAEKKAFQNAVLPVLDMFLKMFNRWLIKGNYKIETVKLGYKREWIPELNIVDKDKTENNILKVQMVQNVQRALSEGLISLEAGINTLVIAAGFSESEAIQVLLLPVQTGDSAEGLDDPQAEDENALAQARLRGSVGGVTGLLAIQTSVAQGVTGREAAIQTLILIYGFTQEQAVSLLGSPININNDD